MPADSFSARSYATSAVSVAVAGFALAKRNPAKLVARSSRRARRGIILGAATTATLAAASRYGHGAVRKLPLRSDVRTVSFDFLDNLRDEFDLVDASVGFAADTALVWVVPLSAKKILGGRESVSASRALAYASVAAAAGTAPLLARHLVFKARERRAKNAN